MRVRLVALGLGCSVVASGLFTGASAQAAVRSTFTINGAGWGHGVGLSQYGAYGMASEGYDSTAIVTHYFQGAEAIAYPDTRELRVNIGHRLASARLAGVALRSGGGSVQLQLDALPPIVVPPKSSVGLRAAGDSVVVSMRAPNGTVSRIGSAKRLSVNWAGTRKPGLAGSVATVMKIAKSSASYTAARFRYGSIDVGVVAGGLEVVNSVRIHDEYLTGIAEVPADWPAAALQAQVIAARSYALTKSQVRAACRCQSDDGSGPYYDQTFVGWARNATDPGRRWRAAVSATATSAGTGRTLVYRGSPITAFYFSSSGGRTANSEDVWGGRLPWARSVDDHWSVDPKYNDSGNASWHSTRSRASLASAFGLSDVVRVQVTSRYASNAVRTVRAYSSSGVSKAISGQAMVSRLGLRSGWITSIS